MRRIIVLLALVCLAACGRYGPPVPPEALSPQGVEDLTVEPKLNSVMFQWRSPKQDLRGKTLKSIDGYIVYRKTLQDPADLVDEAVPYINIGQVADRHLIELRRLQDDARARGALVRSVRVPPELTQFSFSDDTVLAGSSYAYQIVPFHEGNVEGQVKSIVRVAFRGLSSDVSLLPVSDLLDYTDPEAME